MCSPKKKVHVKNGFQEQKNNQGALNQAFLGSKGIHVSTQTFFLNNTIPKSSLPFAAISRAKLRSDLWT